MANAKQIPPESTVGLRSNEQTNEVPGTLLFVAGLARSGTTLFQSIFNQHPDVLTFPETHFFEAAAKLGSFGRNLGMEHQIRFWNEVSGRGGIESSCRDKLLKQVENWNTTDVKTMFLQLLDVHCTQQRGCKSPVVLEKTPGHIFQMPEILKLFPEAKFFLLRRAPLTYAASISKCAWGPDSMQKIGALWSETVELIRKYSRCDSGKVMVIDYEDLISEPAYVMERAFRFVGLKFDVLYLDGLSKSASSLVIESEFSWKSQNLVQDSIIRRKSRTELSLVDRWHLFTSIRPAVLSRYLYERSVFATRGHT